MPIFICLLGQPPGRLGVHSLQREGDASRVEDRRAVGAHQPNCPLRGALRQGGTIGTEEHQVVDRFPELILLVLSPQPPQPARRGKPHKQERQGDHRDQLEEPLGQQTVRRGATETRYQQDDEDGPVTAGDGA